MQIDIITLFPEMFKGIFSESIIKRAQAKGVVDIGVHQLRDFSGDKHRTVDDKPYGGGPGMLMRVDVASKALASFRKSKKSKPYIILLTPKGKKFDQKMAVKLSKKDHLVFLCPHYEGYDHRIESLVDDKISIGDYILTGGELPAAVICDAVIRLIPGVIKAESLKEESFSKISNSKIIMSNKMSNDKKEKDKEIRNYNLDIRHSQFEYPQYTRPEVFEMRKGNKKIKKRVPKVLLSGNHALIAKWRKNRSE